MCEEVPLSLAAGARLGSYEVLAALGAGGMGEVYRARDTRLKREVAIKVLEKDRQRRLPDIGVARLEIDEALSTPPSGRGPVSARAAVPSPPLWRHVMPITKDNGHHPVWTPDGKELSYRLGVNQQIVVSVSTQPSLTFGSPVRVPGEYAAIGFGTSRNYDILPDSMRFIVAAPAGAESGTPATPEIHIVLNWFEELKRRVPTGR